MSEDEAPRERDEPKDPNPPKPEDDAQGPVERGPHELGREFSARAAQPGGARERLGTENDALTSFTSAAIAAGHVAGGNMTLNYHSVSDAENAVRLAQLPQAVLDEVTDLFVDPAGFAELKDAIGAHRVVFLRADPGRGKFMAAKRLLLGSRAVYRLDPETGLGTLTGEAFTEGCGYVLVDLPGSTARELTAYHLTALTTVLEDRDARLVVTVPTGRRFKDPEVAELIRELGEVADRMEILLRHLERRLGDRETDRLADDPALMALVQEEIVRDASPGHAALLAEFAADAVERGEPPVDSVRDRLAMRDETAFENWAEGLPDLPTQSMALAVAVLGGEPYETVSAGADMLQRRLEPDNPLESAEPARAAALVPRKNARLRSLRAHVVPSTVQTGHGGAPVEVVRFRDASFQKKYLRYFWNEYDDARPTLLAWLRLCARHELESVRVRAAVATGTLTARSFDHVRALVIEPWAKDDDPQLRDAAATALRSAITVEPALGPPVRALVRAWSADDSPELQATAARCWRIEHDAAGPDPALKALEELSSSEHLKVTMAICASVTEMWEVVGDRLEAAALLLRWLRKPARRPTARLAFLLAAADLVRRVDGVDWPALLYLTATDPVRHREIAALWRDAVTAPRLHPAAKDILAEWARAAEGEPLVRKSFARLMASAAEGGRSALVIDHEAVKWAAGPRGAPAASTEVRKALHAERRRP